MPSKPKGLYANINANNNAVSSMFILVLVEN
jgi:hypothetical protein